MQFGRTDFSIGTTVHAPLHRHGPVGPSFQGMPDKLDFHVFLFPKHLCFGSPFLRPRECQSSIWLGTILRMVLKRSGKPRVLFQSGCGEFGIMLWICLFARNLDFSPKYCFSHNIYVLGLLSFVPANATAEY